VAVSARRGESVELIAGQGTAVQQADASSLESMSIDVEHAFSWLNGGYEYRNEPIGNVISDLSRRFDLIIEAPESLRLRPISIFNQSDGSIDEILGDISATIGAQYRRIAGGYEIYTP
jgi:ferric-dicitrate binding protein FerR (iron transport regulator)